MKALMLDANGIFNADALEGDFFEYAKNFIAGKQREKIDVVHYETAMKYVYKWVGEHLKFDPGIVRTQMVYNAPGVLKMFA